MGAAKPVVLVVEDELSLLRLIATHLRNAGYAVVDADSGAEAIDALDQHYPPAGGLGLVLLDMMLPDVDGLAVLHHATTLGGFVPVVAMSTSRQALTAAEAAGVHGILSKPFDSDTLLTTVARYCPG